MKIKKVLVVYKKSSYELYGKLRKDKNFLALIRNDDPVVRRFVPSHQKHADSIREIKKILAGLGIESRWIYRANAFSEKGYDLVLSVGGDGTFLEASHSIKRVPILGVNSNPEDSVGTFCGQTSDTLGSYLQKMMADREKPTSMARLRVRLGSQTISTPVLNDILITNATPAATSRIVLSYGNVRRELKCSGVWVSPAAGTTAGIRSAGGKVLPIRSGRFQFVIREPYFPPGQKFRSISHIMEHGQKLVIISKMRTGAVYLDGSHKLHPFPMGQVSTIFPDASTLKVYGFNHARRASFR